MKDPKVSIIIRSKNEERWIKACLSAVFSQSYKDFEVILVDNCSTDKTVEKGLKFPLSKVLSIENFLPGKAINLGIANSRGEYIVLLSAHCIPTTNEWLSRLIETLENDHENKIAGVYGRQEALSFTDDLDKRDLIITFGLDRKVQVKDSFFHNANSVVRKNILDKIPFDDSVTNIEDRIWGKAAIDAGFNLVYEPSASVYHHHGIHQSANRVRARNIVRIIESIEGMDPPPYQKNLNTLKYDIHAVITSRGAPEYFNGKALIEFAIESAKESNYLAQVLVSTDNRETAEIAEACGARVPFIRPAELSATDVGVENVLKYTLLELEKSGFSPDLLVYMSTKHPFREKSLIDRLIALLHQGGFDSVMPGLATYKSCWTEDSSGNLKAIDSGFVAKSKKTPLHIAFAGLATVTHTEFIRNGTLLGPRVGILETLDPFSTLEIDSSKNISFLETVYKYWRETNFK